MERAISMRSWKYTKYFVHVSSKMYYNVDNRCVVYAAVGKSNASENRRKDFLCVSWNSVPNVAFFIRCIVPSDVVRREHFRAKVTEEQGLEFATATKIRPRSPRPTKRRMHYTVHGDVITCNEPWWKRSRRICPNVTACTRVSIAEHISLTTTSLFQSRFKAAKEERIFSILSLTLVVVRPKKESYWLVFTLWQTYIANAVKLPSDGNTNKHLTRARNTKKANTSSN